MKILLGITFSAVAGWILYFLADASVSPALKGLTAISRLGGNYISVACGASVPLCFTSIWGTYWFGISLAFGIVLAIITSSK